MDVDTIYGVDFSASKKDSGRKTWISKAKPSESSLEIVESKCSASFFDSSKKRTENLSNLTDYVKSSEEGAVFGLDFPFSLPQDFITSKYDCDMQWDAFVQEFPPENIDSPDDLNQWGKGEFESLPKRETDNNCTSKPPTHWLIKTQTFYGIRDVISELAAHDKVSVLPFEKPENRDIRVLEVYPAKTFESLGVNRTEYTDVTEKSREKRVENLEALRKNGVELDSGTPNWAEFNDDALDSIAAAYAVWSNLDELEVDEDTIEGRIYV